MQITFIGQEHYKQKGGAKAPLGEIQMVTMELNTEELVGQLIGNTLQEHMVDAEQKAWKSLEGYKFSMFGYWCAIWVHLNKMNTELGNKRQPNPWKELTDIARERSVQ